jgi:membrane protein
MSRLGQARAAATAQWRRTRLEHDWIDHIVRAWARFQDNNASQYAGAITYFSFLALFPLLLLAASIMGFILKSNPHLLHELIDKISTNIPGTLGTELSSSLQTLIDSRTGVGIIGLAGLMFTGLGWIGNLRAAINAVWGIKPAKVSFVKSRIANLFVLAGLGFGVLLSIGLATVSTAVTNQLVSALGWEHVPGSGAVIKLAAIGVGVLGDMLIFGWLLVRLPRAGVSRSVAVRTALLAAIGFEVLKIVGTYTIAKSAHSATLGPFAAWSATATPIASPAAALPSVTLTVPPEAPTSGLSPSAVAVSIFGAGAAFGAGVVSVLRRERPPRQ